MLALLGQNKDKVGRLATELVRRETMSFQEVVELLDLKVGQK